MYPEGGTGGTGTSVPVRDRRRERKILVLNEKF